MDCDLCGTANRANARFCGGCGSALARCCPRCKAELDAGLSFCDQCGATLDATPTATPAPAGAVRKTVTVLFADLGGSTGFGERTDPEISRVVLAQYHALLQETIDAHRGTVAKFMGDGMMATFGIPEVAEDDARRAVLAGVDVQHRFEAFAADVLARYGETLTMRVGINTGEVVIASGDADLVGDALNVAARLEKACRPGHVLVGDETWRITRGDLAYEPLGEVTVAGRAGPVGTYEVIGAGAATADPVAPFVGRMGETTRLRAAFERAGADRQAVLVTVLGSPGMGKTRLSRELASTLAADEDATTFEIRCDRSGGATFAPFADLVREAAGIAEIEDGEDAAEATRDRIGALVRDDADRGRVVDVIAGVLGAAPARSVEETFWGIRRVVESLATDRPLVVVIDDIQWAEPKLLDLLEHLAEWVQAAVVLLVCLARPELRELRPALTEPGRRVADVLALDGLDASATAELAAGLLGSALPTELIDRLPVSTDGNPLFVRELVRMLVDDAVIRRRDDGTWELAIDAEAIEVPPTIQSLLATRVERLPAEELRVLELASVVGAEFSVGALRELAGNDIAMPAVLERLRRKELVEPTGTYWGDDPLHRFHHVLIRDAAYRRLLKTTRADLHRQVGEWTDASAGDLIGEHETAIAFHFEQAHRYRMELGTADQETDRLGRRAAELLSVAARRALDREDLTSAGALARRALAALPEAEVDDRADLLLIACECFLSSGDVTAGAPLVDALHGLSGDNEQLGAWAACYRAQLVGLTDPDGVVAAEETASAAAATLERFGDGAGEAKAQQVRAGLLARLGRVGEAEVVLDLALGAARASDDRRRVTAVLGAAPQAALFGPSPVARAGGRCLDVVRLLRITIASPSVEATSMRCQAVLEALRGRFDVARSMLGSARASLEELGLRHGLLETDLFTGMVELIAGDPGAAIVPLRSAYEGLGTLGVGADAGQAAALLATALLAQGEVDEAELMAGESEALAGQNLKTAIAWRMARAEVHAARGDAVAGVRVAEEAVEIAAGTDLILDHADACVVLADLRMLSGDAQGAERARAEARRLYEAKGATVPAGRLDNAAIPADVSVPHSPPREPAAPRPAGEARTPEAENTMTRIHAEVCVAINRRDASTQQRLVARGFVQEDRRALVGLGDQGRHGIALNHDLMLEQGYEILSPEPIAVRGERLALAVVRARTAAGDESVLLALNELDEDGLFVRSIVFDEDDLAAALTELDDGYLAGEGAPNAEVIEAARRLDRVGADLDALEELLTEDFETVDHRMLAFGAGGRSHFLEASRSNADVGLTPVGSINRVVNVNGRAVLAVRTECRITDDGIVYEWPGCDLVVFDGDGRASRLESFDLEDFTTALVRFDELGAGAPADPRIANLASRAEYDFAALVNRGDLDGLRARISDEFVRHDHRRVTGQGTVLGKDAMLENLAALVELGIEVSVLEIVAIRGDRLALTSMRFEADGFKTEILELVCVDATGTHVSLSNFDDDDLPAALRALDAAYFVGEGEPFQRLLTVCGKFGSVSLRNDTTALANLVAPGFVFTDRRLLGYGEGDRQYLLDAGYTGLDRVDGSVVNRVLYPIGSALLAVQRWLAISDTGSEFEQVTCFVLHVDESGLTDRLELYDEDDFTTARARLHEMGDAPAPVPGIHNAATRRMAESLELQRKRQFEEVRDLYREDFVRDNRRTITGEGVVVGRDAMMENIRAIYELDTEIVREALAIRGDQLMLARMEFRIPGGFESVTIDVIGGDDEGRAAFQVMFDEDQLGAALDELDERYIAGEGGEHEYLIRRIGDFRHARAARNWDGVEALFSLDYVAVDRRPLGLGTGTRDQYLAAARAMVELVPDATFVPRVIEADRDVVLMRTAGSGTSVDGSRSEWEQWVVWRFAGGRVVRGEVFSLEDEPVAQERFAELAAQTLTPHIDNRLLRVTERAQWLRRFTDEVAVAYRSDCVLDDRRPGVNAGVVEGAVAVDASIQSGVDVFGLLEIEPLAVRDERLALVRWAFVADGGFEAPGLCVLELDDDDFVCRITSFDESDLAGAIELLEQRHVELRGDAITPQELTTAVGSRAFNARDWDAMAGVFGRDLRFVTHAPFTTEGGWDDYLAQLQVLVEQVPDVAVVYAKVTTRGRCGLSLLPFTATTPEGSRYSWSMVQVTRMGDDGRIAEFELFDIEQWDDAATLFEAWAAESEESKGATRATSIENTASRLTAEAAREFGKEGAQGSEHQADDLVRVDHRRMIGAPTTTSRDEFADAAGAFADLGMTDLTFDVLAVRGDRCCLGRLTYSGADFGVGFLTVVACNDRDKIAWFDNFDEEDLDAALDTLDERFIAGDGAEHEALIRWWREFGVAYRDRDWAAMEDRYAPDAVLVDRRSIGQGWTNRADFLTSTRAVVELVPDVQHLSRRLEMRGQVTLTDGEAFGTTSDGSRYSWGYHMVTQWAGGRITVLEIFDAEASAAARARFDEIAGETVKPDNAAALLIVGASRLLWTDLDAALDRFSPDAIGVARESGPSLGLSAENRAMWRDVLSSLAETYDDVRYETLVICGDRLALLRQEFVTDGYVTPALLMVETDEHNQIVRLETFAEEDLSRASEELDRRSFELLGDPSGGPIPGPSAELDAMVQSISVAFAARDWESIRSRFTPDAVLEDRRSTVSSHRAVGAEVGELFRGFADVGFETLDQIELASRGEHLVLVRRVYRSVTGFELEMLVVIESQADGRMAAITLFDADALVPALDELELRYARSGTLTHSARQVLLAYAGLNHRRWRELDAVLAPDVDVVDHRRLGFPPATGKQHLIGALQALVVQVPDVVAIVRAIEVSGSAVLAVVNQVGTSADGFAADWAWHFVLAIDAHGLIARMEYFDVDDAVRARARFEEFARRDR